MIDNIIALISAVRDRANKYVTEGMEKRGVRGLVPSHGTILYSLFTKSRLTMKEVADKTGKDKSTVTALVEKLMKEGYIMKEKDTEDSRVTYITLTPLGASLKEDFFSLSRELMDTIYQGFSMEEKVELVSLLSRMKDNL